MEYNEVRFNHQRILRLACGTKEGYLQHTRNIDDGRMVVVVVVVRREEGLCSHLPTLRPVPVVRFDVVFSMFSMFSRPSHLLSLIPMPRGGREQLPSWFPRHGTSI